MADSKILKCANCNIVISELLAYLQNKVDVMDNESMVRICASTYTVAEVEEAKILLFDTIQTKKRNISRRKNGKIERDLEDIIAVLKETDPDVVPVFVARNLNKIPVFCFDHLDPSILLKDIIRLKADVQEIKQTCATVKQLEDLESKWISCKPSSLVHTECRVNNKRGGYLLESGPMGFLTPRQDESFSETITFNGISSNLSTEPVIVREQPQTHTLNAEIPSFKQRSTVTRVGSATDSTSLSHTAREQSAVQSHRSRSSDVALTCSPSSFCRKTECAPTFAVGKNENGTSPADLCQQNVHTDTVRKLSFAELAGNGEKWTVPREDEKWTQVQRKRLRNRFAGHLGKAEAGSDTKFKAAGTKVPLFVSNVHKDVLETDIIDYIFEKTKVRVSLLKIDMKRQRDYNSYKVFVNKEMIDTFLDNNLWPVGITFRRFVSFRQWQGDQSDSKVQTF